MELGFRRAAPTDTGAAQDLYRRIIGHLGRTVDHPHWHSENHPSPAQVERWVRAGDLYLAVARGDGRDAQRIAGAVVLDHQAPEAYGTAAWAIGASREEVLVVHALGVVPDVLRQGVARFLVDRSLDVARGKGCRTVRLDAYVENVPARELYTRHGFTDLGLHTLRYEGTDLSQFHLFEQVL